MTLYVDRIEGGLAVCETQDGEFLTIPLDILPDGVREGSVLERDEAGSFLLNAETEEKRRSELLKRQNELFDE